jgi:hypothetical protein
MQELMAYWMVVNLVDFVSSTMLQLVLCTLFPMKIIDLNAKDVPLWILMFTTVTELKKL